MRITQQLMARTNMVNYQTNAERIYDLNAKIASKTKISQPYEDTGVYVDATRLDYEIEVLDQVQNGTQKASEFAKNADDALTSFRKTITTFKTKLIQAANEGAQSTTSRVAVANDLQALRDQLVNIANTSINGQFVFSGTAIDTKPINDDGTYNGNGELIKVVSGTNQTIPYNVDGKELFLGRDNDYTKSVTTNVTLYNAHEELNPATPTTLIKTSDSIYDLIGANYQTKAQNEANPLDYTRDFAVDDVANYPSTVFFMQGQKPSGETFSAKFTLTASSPVQTLLDRIGEALGNDPTTGNKVVDVSLNENSQIIVKNVGPGNEMLSFSIFGVTEQKGTQAQENEKAAKAADGTAAQPFTPDNLKARVDANGNVLAPLNSAQIANMTDKRWLDMAADLGLVHVTSFVSSPNLEVYNDSKTPPGYEASSTLDYDTTYFEKSGPTLTSNVSQIVRGDNSFASDGSTLASVSGIKDFIKDVNGNPVKDINGKPITDISKADDLVLKIRSKDDKEYTVTINFDGTQIPANTGTYYPTLNIKGNGKDITTNFYKTQWDATIKPGSTTEQRGSAAKLIPTNELTFRNVEDIVEIVASGNFGNMATVVTANPTDQQIQTGYNNFANALKNASSQITATMDHRGQMTITDNISSTTPIKVAIYQERNANDYPQNAGINNAIAGPVFSFNRNDAVTIDRPSVDIFADLDEMIQAVRDGSYFGDPDKNNPRTSGVQGALARIDHLMDHIDKEHAIIGSRSNLITATHDRAQLLSLNVSEVKSNVIDTDYGEVLLELQQRMLSYQAMLSTTSKISQLSLLNYM